MTSLLPTYPKYVPERVQFRAREMLHGAGAGAEDDGWLGLSGRLQARLSEIERLLQDSLVLPSENLAALRRERLDLSEQIQRLQDDMDCMARLTALPDRDMEKTYTLLEKDLGDSEQIWMFIYSAMSARINFAPYRDAIKSALEKKQEIAKVSQQLAALLDWFDQGVVPVPDEFWSVRALLERATASENGESIVVEGTDPEVAHNDFELEDLQDLPEEDFPVGEIEEGAEISSGRDYEHGWQTPPSLSDLLRALSDTADQFEPQEHHLIGAATNKRQHSEKAAYLRAFAHLLDENGIALSPAIQNAMAATATKVLDQHDLVVTLHDARNRLNLRAR